MSAEPFRYLFWYLERGRCSPVLGPDGSQRGSHFSGPQIAREWSALLGREVLWSDSAGDPGSEWSRRRGRSAKAQA